MNDANQPSAQGSLAKTPFAHLVLYLYQRRASGTLIVQSRSAGVRDENRILFHRGRAVAAHLSQPAAALDQALLPLCAARDGQFEFHESDLVGSGPSIVTGMFDPLAFVAESARRQVRADLIDDVLTKFAGVALTLQPAMDLARLSLTGSEAHFAEPLMRGAFSLEELTERGTLDHESARRLLYVLLITKVVGPYDPAADEAAQRSGPPASGSIPTSGASSSSPTARAAQPASDRSRNSGAAWRAIASRAAEIASNRPSSASGAASSRSITPAPPSPAPGAGPVRQPTPAPRAVQPSAAARGPSRAVTQPMHTQPRAARPITPTPRPATVPITPAPRVQTRPLTPAPIPRAESGPISPQARPGSRPLTPAPSPRPASRPLTPASFPQKPDSQKPGGRPVSRPLTPATFGSPSSSPRVTPSAPINRATPRPSQPDIDTLDAPSKFKRVEQLCARNAYDEALPIMRILVEEDRKSAKYLGMLAHVLLGRTTDGQIGKEIVETVNQALRIDADEVRALYTKARCYKRMGKEREALHYFKRTVSVEANHIEATREIRLLLLRMSEKRKR